MTDLATLRWTAVRLATGQIVCDLPNVEIAQGELASTIGQPETGQLALNLTPKTPSEWLLATQPGGSALIGWTGDPSSPTILWGGIVMQRARSLGPKVLLSCQTPDAYLAGCYVGNLTATANQDTLIASLMAFASGTNQVPWVLNHLANASTVSQTVAYTSPSNVTVLSAMQSLSAIAGGPEWFTSWQWNLTAGTVVPVLNYGQRVGQAAANGIPAVTISQSDLADGATFTEDYTAGYGANSVTAYGQSSGSSSLVPTANATAVDLKGRPLWAYVYQPNVTVTDTGVLGQFAASAVSQIQDGSQPMTMTMPKRRGVKQFGQAWGAPGKQFGVDWNLGDDMGYSMGPSIAFPTPISGVARAIGYRIGYDTITPVLQGAKLA